MQELELFKGTSSAQSVMGQSDGNSIRPCSEPMETCTPGVSTQSYVFATGTQPPDGLSE